MRRRVTSIQQHGVAGGDAVAEKRIDFSYDADGLYATPWGQRCRWLKPAQTVTMNI